MTIQEMSIQDRERALHAVLHDDDRASVIGAEIARVLLLRSALGEPWNTVYGASTSAGLARLVLQILLTGD